MMRPLLAVVVLLAVLVGWSEKHVTVVNGQVPDDPAKTFLDTKERDVMAISANATANNNRCQGLNGCGVGEYCSRAVCYAPVGSAKSMQQCYTVDNNENFNICSTPACPNMLKLDYKQSFVTLPAPGYLSLQPEVAKDICLQKPLDEGVFKYISQPKNYSNVFFGSVSGAIRAYPGKEGNKSYCAFFDTRRRPWYLNGISVSKDVKILIDVSLSMGNPYSQGSGTTTYLNLTQNITHALLQTFSPQDFVQVFKFDRFSSTSLANATLIDATFGSTIPEEADRKELKPLIEKVNSLVVSQVDGASNLTNALNQATLSFRQSGYSRVIIVLTNGQFSPMDPAYFPTTKLVSTQTKLMIYKLDPYLTSDTYLQNTSLEKVVCSVNGSFEVVDSDAVPNPLYAMRSYFTFLAQTQLVAAENKPSWSFTYASVTQDLSAITVTYPAFGSDGQLIGVVGVDVILDGFNRTFQQSVNAELKNRGQGTLPVPSNIPLTCSYQKADAVVQCQNETKADNSAICQPNLAKTIPLQDLTCCGNCNATEEPGLSTEAKVGIGVGVPIGGILVFAVIAGIFFCICRRRVHEDRKSPTPPPIDGNIAPLRNPDGDPR